MRALNETRASCNATPRSQFDFLGYSLRNANWRSTAWYKWDGSALRALWDGELYAHTGDESRSFDAYENVNLASAQPAVALALRKRLREFFDRSY